MKNLCMLFICFLYFLATKSYASILENEERVPVDVAQELPEITRIVLINAVTDDELFTIQADQIIALAEIETSEINIRAYTSQTTVGSVSFELRGAQSRPQIENNAPYAIFGDRGNDFFSWTPALGSYSLTTFPFTEKNAKGDQGIGNWISFTIINSNLLSIGVYN